MCIHGIYRVCVPLAQLVPRGTLSISNTYMSRVPRRSGSNHSSAIPLRYDCANVTLARSALKALHLSWKLSSHCTKKVWSFLGLVPLKVSGLRTRVCDDEDSLFLWALRASTLIAPARLLKTMSPGSSWFSWSSTSLSLNGSFGSSSPGSV